ncbi:M16 family metallopeptidase [Thiolinea disciformis]|uniref:M16 family metallopeptidase n=1 Tax=Thiolinea disciformis TaxID=125614 RepID=UPI00035FA061|nr:pitrilysin family protein [Thiolinea disciformis]
MKKIMLCSCLMAASWVVSAQESTATTAPAQASSHVSAMPASQAADDLAPRFFTLKNGMQLIVKPDHRAPTAVHMLWHRVGAMDELSGTTGVAHVLEHMLFKGTPTVKGGEFSRRVAALGGDENAFTSDDYTAYYQQIPKEKLEEVMKLESDRFVNNEWPDEEFKKELEVVKEERRMRTDDRPRSLLYEQLMAATYMAHPYQNPIIGWMTDLDNMTPNDARAFYKKWYNPLNAALVVAGDVKPDEAYALAEKYYGALPTHPVEERKVVKEPAQTGMRALSVKAPADQPYLLMAFKVPQLRNVDNPTPSDWDALTLTVLSAILDGNDGSRFERNLINSDNRIADSASTSNGLYGRGPQLFFVEGVPSKGKNVGELQAALRAQIKRVAEEGVTEAELQRVKTQWIASEVYQRDSVFSQANQLGSLWAIGLPLDTKDKMIEMLRKITADQVKAVAQKYFNDDQLTVAVLNPQPRDPNAKPRTPPAGLRH